MHGRKPHSGPKGPFQFSVGALAACVPACLLALLVIPATGAQAATKAKRTSLGGIPTITITVDPGEEHDISVGYDPDQGRYEISDIGAMDDEVGCNYIPDPDNQIVCAAGTPVSVIKVITGDQDDSISLDLEGGEQSVVTTGAGDDFVDGLAGHDDIDGGSGDDIVSGNDGTDTLVGGSGDDVIDGGNNDDSLSGGDGNDALSGDDGSDTLHGDDGEDLADYVTTRSAVTVDLDGNGDDGRAEEHDNVKPDVENIRGGSGNDVLTGNDSSNMLSGGDGDDLLRARDTSADALYCGRGNDSVIVDSRDTVDPKCDKTDRGEGALPSGFKIVISGCPGKTKNASTACVRVRCPGAQGACTGKVSLEATVLAKPAKVKKGKRRPARSKRVKVGSNSFKAADGSTAAVTVKLSKQGARLLGSRGKLAVRAIVEASDQAGAREADIGTVKLAAKLKAGKKRR
jgi:hypothetical protein